MSPTAVPDPHHDRLPGRRHAIADMDPRRRRGRAATASSSSPSKVATCGGRLPDARADRSDPVACGRPPRGVRLPGLLRTRPRERIAERQPSAARCLRAPIRPPTARVADLRDWFASPRFAGHRPTPYRLAKSPSSRARSRTTTRSLATAAEAFYARLRDLFEAGRQITTFGPYSPGQAVVMKRLGIEGIYLGGWATSAKGSATEDPGPISRATR